jgi:hypothetical protein
MRLSLYRLRLRAAFTFAIFDVGIIGFFREAKVVELLRILPGNRSMKAITCCLVFCIASCSGQLAMAQTLAPRAYVITPKSANAITFSWSYFDGSLNFNGAIPRSFFRSLWHCS